MAKCPIPTNGNFGRDEACLSPPGCCNAASLYLIQIGPWMQCKSVSKGGQPVLAPPYVWA